MITKDDVQMDIIENMLDPGKDKKTEAGKGAKRLKKSLGRALKAGILGRLGVDVADIKDKAKQEEVIKNKLINDCVPVKVKQSIDRADRVFGDFLRAN